MNNIDNIVYRIMSGELLIPIDGTMYKLINPDPRTKYKAECVYQETLNNNRFGPFLNDSDCLKILVKNDLCSLDIDANLKLIDDRIDDLKVQLFDSIISYRADTTEKSRKELNKVKDKQVDMIITRHMFDHLTLHGFAEMVKRQYLVYSTLCYSDDSLVWKNIEDIDVNILEQVINFMKDMTISQKDIRYMARHDPWRSYWNINKANPFDKPPIHLTDEQRILIVFSKMYDSIMDHPECPQDNIIGDDDALDGWMIKERKKREQDRLTNQLDKKLKKNKHQKADEVFIPVGSKDEAKKINRLNDIEAQLKKIQRKKMIESKGEVQEAQLPDRKLQVQMQAVNQRSQTLKKR